MRIGVVGLGYVGLVTAVALATVGNEIIGVDIDAEKVTKLKQGIPTIYEPGLEDLFKKFSGNMEFSTTYLDINEAKVVYLIVPTPTVNSKIDLHYVFEAAEKVKEVNSNAVLAIKSTVVPGTAKQVHEKTGMSVVSNPEFTREGSAINDTLKPDRIIIGGSDEKAVELVASIWSFSEAPIIKTTNENAELIKYASNAFLATKISFINEIANLCEKIPSADVDVVAKGMGLDKRIAPYFLNAGIGYGGSCFPKDTKAITEYAKEKGERLSIVEAAISVNEKRVERVVNEAKLIARKTGKDKVTIGVLGIAFKDSTDDIRESQALKLINTLIQEGFNVIAYDPIVKSEINGITKAQNKDECINSSDIIIVATEWPEFKGIEEKTSKPIIDARRLLDASKPNVFPIGLGRLNR
ncbi:MAG: UDP-glucose dehydrogenase family protein [Candidatus Micrarchaeia archaeon]